jgi:hypothetical protein
VTHLAAPGQQIFNLTFASHALNAGLGSSAICSGPLNIRGAAFFDVVYGPAALAARALRAAQ